MILSIAIAQTHTQHDAFHDPVSLKEQGNQRDVSGWQRQGGLCHVGRIHKRCPLNTGGVDLPFATL
jgi:hypothetical protein